MTAIEPCDCPLGAFCPHTGRVMTLAARTILRSGDGRSIAAYFRHRDPEGVGVGVGVASPRPGSRRPPAHPVGQIDELAYLTTARLIEDTRTLASRLPSDVDLVVGVARSGLLPASLIATILHVPLKAVAHGTGITDPGGGGRMSVYPNREWPEVPRRVALVDDTAATGREMRRLAPVVRGAFPGSALTRAVVYAHPAGRRQVDLCVATYPGPHYLEWNVHNSGHAFDAAYDFDGVLCPDIDPADDDDGPRYLAALESAPPLSLPRRTPISLIVTARHGRYREVSSAWLDRQGIRFARLVMRDWDYPGGRFDAKAVAAWKARVYARAPNRLMIESDPRQARWIATRSGKRVLCPAAGRAFDPPRGPSRARGRFDAAATRAVLACPDRKKAGCACSGKAACARDGREVAMADCLECVRRDGV